MTWLEFANIHRKGTTSDEAEYLLWNETAYPMGSLKFVTKQFRSALRRLENHIQGCELCGQKIGFCDCKAALRGKKDEQ